MDINNIIFIKNLPLDIDCINIIYLNIIHSLKLVNHHQISKLLGRTISISLDFDKVLKYGNEEITLYHCGVGYNASMNEKVLTNASNIILFKHVINIYPATINMDKPYSRVQIEMYQQIMSYIKNNPHKLYIFGSSKADLTHLPELPNGCYIY